MDKLIRGEGQPSDADRSFIFHEKGRQKTVPSDSTDSRCGPSAGWPGAGADVHDLV
jgi:hypothetical protein